MDGSKNQLIQVPSLFLGVVPPFSIKKSVIEGTVHRVFRSTSTWEGFDKATKLNRKQWSDNQYLDHSSSRVASRALKKIKGENITTRSEGDNQIASTSSKELPTMRIVQYRGTHTLSPPCK